MEDAEEAAHFASVARAFTQYGAYARRRLARRERHLKQLPAAHRARLPPATMTTDGPALERAVAANQAFFDAVVAASAAEALDGAPPADQVTEPPRHFSKLGSTLHQLVRDWAPEGAAEREQCYAPLLAELRAALPVTEANRNRQRVLVPGAGLGRLLLDVCAAGYAAQGNEFSYHMLFTSNFLLNCSDAPLARVVHPWADSPCNQESAEARARAVAIPDVVPGDVLRGNPGFDFSMCAGEFLEVYGGDDSAGAWDCVLTCFFVDTAPNVVEYLELFWRLLRPGGVWINLGPLLYHWFTEHNDVGADERYHQSVELSWAEVRHVAEDIGFRFTRDERRECSYTADPQAMMRTAYNCVFSSAVRPAGPEEG